MARAQLQYEATLDDHVKSDFDAAAADFNAVFAAASVAQDAKDTLNLDVNNSSTPSRRRPPPSSPIPGDRRAGQGVRPVGCVDQDLGTRRRDGRRRRGARRRQADAEAMIDLAA